MYLHQGDTVQIEAPEFDPDIDGDSPASMDEKHEIVPAQGTLATIPEVSEPEDDNTVQIPRSHQEAPQRSTEELKRIFQRGRGQATQEELHSHRPFGPRTCSLQSRIQCKIKKNQHLHERYTSHH